MSSDKFSSLGMEQQIDRRDFIGGVAASAALLGMGGRANALVAESTAVAAAAASTATTTVPANYPPLATGLRGQYPGSFEVAHSARDGAFAGAVSADDTGERYDLVIVGGGISGLAAAYF